MNKFVYLAAGCLLLTACGHEGPQGVSANQSSAALPLPQAQAPAPAVAQTYPKALPQNIPNNIMMPQDNGGAPPVDSYGQVPPAPSTVMTSDQQLYSGYAPSATPPPGAEDKSVSMNPVPDPSQQDFGQISVPTSQQQVPLTPPTPAVAPLPSYPTANPVPGHPGMVYSPFGTTDQWVDVSSFPPGSKVKCPFTGKVFLTPAD